MKIGPWRSKAANRASRPKSPKPADMRAVERAHAIDHLCANGMSKADAEAEFLRRDRERRK